MSTTPTLSAPWLAVARLWRHRTAWLAPLVLIPAAVLVYVAALPMQWQASTTLQVDTQNARAPLLQNPQANLPQLKDILTRPTVLADAAQQSGRSLPAAAIGLTASTPQILTLTTRAEAPTGLETFTGALADTFIQELLAPERLRLEQRLAQLSDDLNQVGAPASPSDTLAPTPGQQRATAQALQTEYQATLADLTRVNGAFVPGTRQALIWQAAPTQLIPPQPVGQRLLRALPAALLLGLLGALYAMHRVRRAARKRIQPARLPEGVSTLGTLPNLGNLQLSAKGPQVLVGQAVLNPTDFTEVVRLHRAVMRHPSGPVLITCTTEGEGASLLSALLAFRNQSQGKPTLLVDLNLKNGTLTRQLGQHPAEWVLGTTTKSKKQGLPTTALAPELDFLPLPSDAASLAWLAHGTNTPLFLDALCKQYQYVIIDSTPLTATNRQNADPLTLAATARTVLVAAQGVTPTGLVQGSISQLTQSGANLLGVVFNAKDDPDPRTVLQGMLSTIRPIAPGLSSWLRAKL